MGDFSIGPIISTPCPCKECHDKYEACHGKCRCFLEWKDELEKNKEAQRKENDRYVISDTKKKWMNKRLRWNSR